MQSKSLLRFNSLKAASISSIATLPPHALWTYLGVIPPKPRLSEYNGKLAFTLSCVSGFDKVNIHRARARLIIHQFFQPLNDIPYQLRLSLSSRLNLFTICVLFLNRLLGAIHNVLHILIAD